MKEFTKKFLKYFKGRELLSLCSKLKEHHFLHFLQSATSSMLVCSRSDFPCWEGTYFSEVSSYKVVAVDYRQQGGGEENYICLVKPGFNFPSSCIKRLLVSSYFPCLNSIRQKLLWSLLACIFATFQMSLKACLVSKPIHRFTFDSKEYFGPFCCLQNAWEVLN